MRCRYVMNGITLTRIFESEVAAKAFFGNRVTWIRAGSRLLGAPSKAMVGCTEVILEPVDDSQERKDRSQGSRDHTSRNGMRHLQETCGGVIPPELGGEQ